jgi:pyruvate kinase
MPPAYAGPLAALRRQVSSLLEAIDREERARRKPIDAAAPEQKQSATNLAHYLGLRKQDVRRLQLDLAGLGLSSLGRSDGHVRDTLLRLDRWLSLAMGTASGLAPGDPLNRDRVEAVLHENTQALFGPRPKDRHVYVMVTAPDANEVTREWTDRVLRAGADLLRVNGAHESPEDWLRIVEAVRARAAALERQVRVFVDLPGPKLRAEIRSTQPAVLHFPRTKDRFGRTTRATAVRFAPRFGEGPVLPLPAGWFARMRTGDRLRLADAAGRARELIVAEVSATGIRTDCERSLYLTSGLAVSWHRRHKRIADGKIGRIPRVAAEIILSRDDRFLLNESGHDRRTRLPVLACPEPGLLAQVKRGERVVLDDGKLVAVVEASSAAGATCRVTATSKSPLRLRSGKGLAFPDSRISLPSLGAQDEAALQFAIEHADGVDVSFVNSAPDVERIVARLRASAKPGFGMVLKLETKGAVRNLPEILFAALAYRPAGLMIARGDLAVEASFEHLAELQEEILGFGEASHLPVIWATQVLDTLAHSGVPTRAEMTDAAMSMRAECVMLNKGPFVVEATRMLAGIIRDMEPRQYKKRTLFARLAELPPEPAPGAPSDGAAAGAAAAQIRQ